MANLDTTSKKLLRHFSLIPKKVNNVRTILPAKIDPETGDIRAVQMDTDVQRLFKEWVNDLSSLEDLKNRFQRYKDILFMVCNSGYISLAAKLYANETISPDESGKIINVYAKDKKVEAYINEFFAEIGINRAILEDTAFGVATLADHFWIRSIEAGKGIVEITPINAFQITSRLEFSAVEQLRKETKGFAFAGGANALRIEDLEQVLTDKIKNTDYAAMYKKYLFGYALEDNKLIMPPWAISHFRRFSSQSEFEPYGRPLLINSLSLFREYMSGKNLLAMARVARFPKEVFKVKVDENMTAVEKMIAINEARQEYQNFITLTNGKEDVGIGQSIWTALDSFEYELQQNNLDLGDIADIELLRDELIASTLIPKGYLIAGSEGGWGEQSKALLQQSKVFAREVFTNQTAILTELTDLVKTQFVLMNMFDKEDTEFELSLAFPMKEESGENITIQKDTMELAQAVIDNLKTALAIDSIPPDVAKDILHTYAAFDQKDLDRWMKAIQASVDLEIKQAEFEEPKFVNYKEEKDKKMGKALKRLSETIFRESYFNAKKKTGLLEGVSNSRHYYFSPKVSKADQLKFELIRESNDVTFNIKKIREN